MKLRAITSISLAVSALALSACTPPMPPELKAQLADQNVSCVSGTFNLGSNVDLPNLADWISEYNAICGANGSIVDPASDPTVAIDGFVSTDPVSSPPCTVATSSPIALDGTVAALSVEGLDSVILSPSVLHGILNGSITQWNDPFIAEINPDSELPNTPIVVDSKVTPGDYQALSKWLYQLDSTAWQTDPALLVQDPTALQATQIISAPVNGTIGIYPYSFAANNSLALASIQASEVVDANLESLASGATQLKFADNTKLGTPIYDSNIPPVSLQGDNEATTPWGAINSTMLHICSGSNEKVVQAFARYAARLDAQGSLVDLNMTSMGEGIRAITLEVLAVGLPEPKPIPSTVVIPDVPEPTEEPTEEVTMTPEEVTSEEPAPEATS